MRKFIFTLIILVSLSTQCWGQAWIKPAFSKWSSATGSVDSGVAGTNTMDVVGAMVGKVGGKPTLTIPHPKDMKADFGAKGDGITDDTAACVAAASSGGVVTGEGTFLCDSFVIGAPTKFVGLGNFIFKARGSGTPFISVASADVALDGVTADLDGKDVSRGIKVNANSARFKIKNFVVKNINSSTFARGIDISDVGVTDFDVSSGTIDNLTSAANGTIGDINGATRAIYFGGASSGSNPATPSWGKAHDLTISNIFTVEDGDGIQYQSSYTNLFFEIYNIRAISCAKRAIKLQAQNATVRHIDVDATALTDRMYSMVSVYADNAIIEDVSGTGLLAMGVEVTANNVTVNNIQGVNTGTANTVTTAQGFALVTSGSNIHFDKIYCSNFEHGLAINNFQGNISNVTFRNYDLLATREAIVLTNVNTYPTLDSVKIQKGRGVTTGSFQALGSNPSYTYNIVTNLTVEDADLTSNTTDRVIYFGQTQGLTLRNIKTYGSAPVAAYLQNPSDLKVEGVSNKGTATTSLFLNAAIRAIVKGVNSLQALTEVDVYGGDDVIVDGVYARPSGTAVKQENSPTNVQTANLLNYRTGVAGPNIITNGTFDTDTAWNKYNGATISGGVAVLSGSGAQSVGQTAGIINGATYQITYDLVSVDAGGGTRVHAGWGTVGTNRTAPGTYTETLVANTTGGSAFYFEGTGGYSATIDNVVVQLMN